MTKTKPHFYDPIADATVKLVAYDSGGAANGKVASGFIVEGNKGRFLITNYHVLLGISPKARFENANPKFESEIEVWHGGVPIGRLRPGVCQEYLVHPNFRQILCDIAAVPIDLFYPSPLAKKGLGPNFLFEGRADGFHLVDSLNGIHKREINIGVFHHQCVEDMFLPIGRDATVFGYPGAYEFNFSPIGVNTKIASDAYGDEPSLLLSGPVYKGCSGAPVSARSIGGYQAFRERNQLGLGGSESLVYAIEIEYGAVALADQILGIYSGRLSAKDDEPNVAIDGGLGIGQVWKWRLVLEVMEEGIVDRLA